MKNLDEVNKIIIRMVESGENIKADKEWDEFIAISPAHKEYAEAYNELREYAQSLKEPA